MSFCWRLQILQRSLSVDFEHTYLGQSYGERNITSTSCWIAAVMLGEQLYIYGGASGEQIFGELLEVRPAYTQPNASIVFGPGKEKGVAGLSVQFTVQNQDTLEQNQLQTWIMSLPLLNPSLSVPGKG